MAMEIRKLATAFSLDQGRKGRGGRMVDDAHLKFVRTLPCVITGATFRVEAAHIRMAEPSVQKPGTPMARKPDDCWVVPLSADQHRDQHAHNEREWWQGHGINVIAFAQALYMATGDRDKALLLIEDTRAASIPPWSR